MNTKLISNLILFFYVSPDAILCPFMHRYRCLTLVLNIELNYSCHPIVMYVCFIN